MRGRVQGVWFRDSTRREARRLGITGHAINLANGDVEVLACGSPAALDLLTAWLQEGPPLANVSGCEVSEAQFQQLAGFTIG
ncbi:MAG: acylphosphatase [Woeseiaceae bacterium]|nr:acylphosphatase [Woeseiaceae bacterium]